MDALDLALAQDSWYVDMSIGNVSGRARTDVLARYKMPLMNNEWFS